MKNDILSKLLAKERIKVIRKTVDTASFDIKNRILTLPAWKHISDSLELMLICHEVGHALYTTEDIVEEFCKLLGVTQKTLRQSQFSYLNVVEDVRIEQLIALKYPGVKKHFVEGYVEFVEEFKAFKGADKLSLDSLLIDRINVHCKVSNLFTVPFSDFELEILGRVQTNESKLAVASLAKEIYDYDKSRLNTKKKPKKEEEEEKSDSKTEKDEQAGGSAPAPEEFEESDEKEESEEKNADSEEESGNEDGDDEDEEEPEPETAFEEHDPLIPQKQNVSTSFMVKDDFLIPWVHFSRSNATEVSHVDHPNGCVKYLREWREKNMPAVNYLVKEFNMRAAAASMKNVHEHQTGLLNARKLATHQLDKRIFLTKEIVEEGQSHGVIVAVDYSGSMEGMIGKVLRQALMVAEFCKKTQIPFSVFLYTTGDNPMLANVADGDSSTSRMFAGSNSQHQAYCRGFEVLSSQMPKADYERAARLLMWRNCWSANLRVNNGLLSFTKMSGTPTINAMLSLYNQVDAMKKKANVDKVCVYLLTDGDADSTSHSQIYLPDGRMVDMVAPEGAGYTVAGMHQLKTVYNVMKDRYGDSVHVCGIRLAHKRPGSQTSYELHKFLTKYESVVLPDFDTDEHKSTWKAAWAEGSYICKNPVAADSWIYAFVDDVEEMDVAKIDVTGKTSKALSKEFSKKLDKANIERNLLNFIVDAIK